MKEEQAACSRLISDITCVHALALPSDLQVIPESTTSSLAVSITSPPGTPTPSLPPSSWPAGDWVPLGRPVRRWTSTGWGGGGRHEGREGGHGLADGLDSQVLGLGLTRPALPVPLGTMATAAPPPQLPLPLLRQWLRVAQCLTSLVKLTILLQYSRYTNKKE